METSFKYIREVIKLSTFCNFFTYSSDNNLEIKSLILEEIQRKKVVRTYDDINTILENNLKLDELDIAFDAFAISLSLLDSQDEAYKSDEYNLHLNTKIYFSIYNEVKDWEDQIMKFLGSIMRNIGSDCVFEYYGEAVLLRKDGKIIVDESRTGRLDKFPYELIKLDYFEGQMN